jgi:hypothetical protein
MLATVDEGTGVRSVGYEDRVIRIWSSILVYCPGPPYLCRRCTINAKVVLVGVVASTDGLNLS